MSAEQKLKTHFKLIGIVLMLEGLAFLFCPELTVKLLYLSPLNTAQAEKYARIAGLAITVIGYYYFVAGYYGLIGFYRGSLIERMLILPAIGAMVYFYGVELPFLAFGVQDWLTAIWSYFRLKAYDRDRTSFNKRTF